MQRRTFAAAASVSVTLLTEDAEENGEVDMALIDAQEALSSIDADWEADSGGKSTLCAALQAYNAAASESDRLSLAVEPEQVVR